MTTARQLRRAATATTAALILSLGLGACGNSDSEKGSAPSPSETSTSETSTSETDSAEEATDGASEEATDAATDQETEAAEGTSTTDPEKDTSDDGAAPAESEFAMPPMHSDGFPAFSGSREIVDTRVGFHDGYDRFVIEFADPAPGMDDELPGYSVDYVDEPTYDASGLPVEHKGEAALMIYVSGVAIPSDPSDDSAFQRMGGRDGSAIQDVIPVGPFEGMAQTVIGLDKQRPIKVTMMHDPVRLVVDIAHR